MTNDYFAYLVAKARICSEKAMDKYPQPNYVLNKVSEEHGEVIKAVIHYTEGRETWENLEAELVDNLAMLIRLVTEGDEVIGFSLPEHVKNFDDSPKAVAYRVLHKKPKNVTLCENLIQAIANKGDSDADIDPLYSMRPPKNSLLSHLADCSDTVNKWPEWKKKGSDVLLNHNE